MLLSKSSVVLVAILGTSWFTGDTFVSAGSLTDEENQQTPQGYNQQMPQVYNQQIPQGYNQQIPQGYNQQMPQGYNQQMPQGYNQQMPQGYNQQIPQGNNQLIPQAQSQTRYIYANPSPQPAAPVYQPPPQIVYVSAPPSGGTEKRSPLLHTWDGIHDWAQNIVQSGLGQNPLNRGR